LAKFRDRRVGVSEVLEHVGEIRVRRGIARIDRQRLAIGVDRRCRPARIALRVANVVVQRRRIGIEREGFRIALERALGVARFEPRVTEIEPRFEERGPKFHRALEARDRILEPARVTRGHGDEVMRIGRGRRRRHRAGRERRGARPVARMDGAEGLAHQRVRIAGLIAIVRQGAPLYPSARGQRL